MQVTDIKDQESLEALLDQRPADDARIIAERAALRVGVIWFQAIANARAHKRDVTALPILQCLLISGAALKIPTPEVRAALSAASTATGHTAFAVNADAVYAVGSGDLAADAESGAARDAAKAIAAAAAAAASRAPFGDAAIAAAADSAAYATADFWNAIRADCAELVAGNDFDAAPLWGIEPDWFRQDWPKVRAQWTAPASPYAFWARWYDGMVKGDRLPLPLLHDIALIDNAEWEAGPERIAELIAGIEAKHMAASWQSDAEVLLQAALADFTFDSLHRVMRMVPFQDDIRHLRDPERLASFLDDADTIRDDLELFSRAIGAEGQMQGAGFLRTYLDDILEEFSRARQTEHLRVGRIVELGKIIEEYASSPSVADEFGPIANALRTHVRSLLDLTRRHFAATLTRMAPLRDISSGPDDNQWDLLQDIQRGIKAMSDSGTTGLPPLAKDDQAVLLSMADGIERLLRQNDVVPTPQGKASLRREIDHGLTLLAVTIALYKETAAPFAKKADSGVDFVLKNFKRGMGLKQMWDLIKPFLGL